MNQKLIGSLTVSLLITTLSTFSSTTASASELTDQKVGEQSVENLAADLTPRPASSLSQAPQKEDTRLDQQSNEVEKVGEQKPTFSNESAKTIAKIHAHQVSGRKAATLYVRNIPILTFIAKDITQSTQTKVGTQLSDAQVKGPTATQTKSLSDAPSPSTTSGIAIAQVSTTLTESALNLDTLDADSLEKVSETDETISGTDPIARATAVAAKINQLYQDETDGKTITVSWDQPAGATSGRYLIKASKVEIAAIDSDTILPDTTRDLEQDALQATNRLRRLLSNAAPLQAIAGKASFGSQLAFSSIIQRTMTGFASWYGPGFHGNRSASGEVFNQHALTAAHRTLPFGTQVVVTNLDNGQSVIVRINDRGPYHGNRVIDLSAGAARILGLVQSGVAPVRVEVVAPEAITAGN